MGTFPKGILGPFSGKVGTVVGAVVNGKAIMRSLPSHSSGQASLKQLEQRLKFGMMTHFLSALTGFLHFGFLGFTKKDKAYFSAVAYALDHAVSGTYPAYTVDYAQVLVARGNLPNAGSPVASAPGSGNVRFVWTNNAGAGTASANDKAMLVVYCPLYNLSIYTTGSALRSANGEVLSVSPFVGQAVETWISFIDADGKETASSLYTGNITVT